MSLNDYAKSRVEEILDLMPEDDANLLRSWVSTSSQNSYEEGVDSGKGKASFHAFFLGGALLAIVSAIVLWLLTFSNFATECPPVKECPQENVIHWKDVYGGPVGSKVGLTNDLACIQWAGTFSCVPLTREPEVLPIIQETQ